MTTFGRRKSAVARGVVRRLGILSLLAIAASSLRAQQPVVFVHGLAANGSTWDSAATRLARDYYVTTYLPSLPSTSVYEAQGRALITDVSGVSDTAIAIGHSNGGIVAREANGEGRKWKGIITVGTPHAGAALAANVNNDNVFQAGAEMAIYVADPFVYYSQFSDDVWTRIFYGFGKTLYTLGRVLPTVVASIGLDSIYQVLPEMHPGSAFLAGSLNGAANLTRERTSVLQRIGIVSTTDNGYAGMLWKGISPAHWKANTIVQYSAGAAFALAFEYYNNYSDPTDPFEYDKQANAFLWLGASDVAFELDGVWCSLIGASDGNISCTPSDGIVPAYSQQYVGGTKQVNVTGPAHLEEPDAGVVYIAIQDLFSTTFDVPSCASTVGAVTVAPAGATVARTGAVTLAANVQSICGGAMDIGANWTTSDAGVATVSSSGVVTGQAPGTATITATARGLSASANITVVNATPLSQVAISGPTLIPACTGNTWHATVTGGVAPFSFVWTVNTDTYSTGSSSTLSYADPGGNMSLFLHATVRDATGVAVTSGSFRVNLRQPGSC